MTNGDNSDRTEPTDDTSQVAFGLPAMYPASSPVEEMIQTFWDVGPHFHSIRIGIEPTPHPLDLLEQLGPSPFERGVFPLVGFLATTYEKVSRYAVERSKELRGMCDT